MNLTQVQEYANFIRAVGRRDSGRGSSGHARSFDPRLGATGFKAKEAQEQATVAKEAYKAGLRLLDKRGSRVE